MEAIIIAGSICGSIVMKQVYSYVRYKAHKNRLKKNLYNSLDMKNEELFIYTKKKLESFDTEHNKSKTEKYLYRYAKNHKDELNLTAYFSYMNGEAIGNWSHIWNLVDEDNMNDIVDEKLEEIKEVMGEVERRKRELMIRKNKIRQHTINKLRKLKPKRENNI